MVNTGKVSIITACYNSEKFITETYQSIVSQTYTNWEWIIVDDGSTDNSVSIINSYNDDRIKLEALSQNSGVIYCRNLALEMATGRYITILDSDDMWLPSFLEETIDFLESHNEVMVSAGYHRVDEDNQKILLSALAPDYVTYDKYLYTNSIPLCATIYDSEKVGKVQFPDVKNREDYAMWLTMLKKTPYNRSIPKVLTRYRMRKKSASSNKFKMLKYQFLVYHSFLNLPLYKSIYYTLSWAIIGIRKHNGI